MTDKTNNGKPAVFLDRDGTLIRDLGALRRPERIRFYRAAVPALLRLQERAELFVVTNQSGIAKGLLTADEAEAVNAHVVESLRREEVRIRAVYTCPHRREDRCVCMKPAPFFAEQAAAEYGVDLKRSFAVGDHPHDVVFAERFGGRGIYVLTGHGRRHAKELHQGVTVCRDIGAAAARIIDLISEGC